jgi:pimeloyl-ACP methyl ester carboxylesterase/nucleoside-diphosphate-sugar epimerase
MAHIFITGGTGFIGTHTLDELARLNHSVSVLVRSLSRWEQIRQRLSWGPFGIGGENTETDRTLTERIVPVIGDLSLPGLGLSATDRERVLTADVLIHAGGPMDIQLSEAEARAVFLQAAEEMLHLATGIQQRGGLKHFIHVVGFKSPFTDENIHDTAPILAHLKQESPYEYMKFLADLRIREGASALEFPLSIVHPSVVIGSSLHGETPQTGGLGILVSATARGLMQIVPGGSTHWLPLVHVDHVAAFISSLTLETAPVSQTYYLLDDPKVSPSMHELVASIAKELRVSKPKGSISPTWLGKLLGTPFGQKLGIPQESLTFIVEKSPSFPLTAKENIQQKYGLESGVTREIVPFTIVDLDFQVAHGHTRHADFVRGKRGPLASLERIGRISRKDSDGHLEQRSPRGRVGERYLCAGLEQIGQKEDRVLQEPSVKSDEDQRKKPTLLFVHGTLSGADCLLPLAEQFPEYDVCLVDLPGFGRSPYHHAAEVIEGHIAALVEAICALDTPVTLVGHSLGGLLAAHAYARVPERIHRLHLLQPALGPAARKFRSARLNAVALRWLRAKGLQKQLLTQGCFVDISDIPTSYVTYVLQDLQSPRVRRTTAETLSALARAEEGLTPQLRTLLREKAAILWGTQDRGYVLAEELRSANTVEIGEAHHFPISHPQLTAQLLRQQGL